MYAWKEKTKNQKKQKTKKKNKKKTKKQKTKRTYLKSIIELIISCIAPDKKGYPHNQFLIFQ